MAQRALQQATINRSTSLKEHFGGRYFTAAEAKEFLKIDKTHVVFDLLRALLDRKIICKNSAVHPAQYKYAPIGITLADVAEESKRLQAQAIAAGAEPVEVPGKFKRYESLGSEKSLAEAKQKIARAALPNTLEINGVKYVRMDKLAEMLVDQL